ncbi:MAG TPA: GlsB/YeaQ/YmgE family stress response membrane protein [Burkholderiaceae bacterium]|nr:GlsB/YeaQ/YmgE family stress response membrane protein [Burkholderiaceae bacterium]
MGLIWSAIVGLVVGAVAKFFMPGEQGGGIIVTMILGILGSVVATWIGQAVGLYPPGASAGFIASVLGAILLLWVYGLVRKKS